MYGVAMETFAAVRDTFACPFCRASMNLCEPGDVDRRCLEETKKRVEAGVLERITHSQKCTLKDKMDYQ